MYVYKIHIHMYCNKKKKKIIYVLYHAERTVHAIAFFSFLYHEYKNNRVFVFFYVKICHFIYVQSVFFGEKPSSNMQY